MSDSHNDMQAFAQIWDLQARDLWGEHYPLVLAELLHTHGVKTILDCSGGTGFPAIEFKQQGLNISYSDGSPEMLAFFNAKRVEKKLTIPTYLSSWKELPIRVPYTYDAVLCRGNSLIFTGAYSDEAPVTRDVALTAMRDAIQGMFSKVAEGGLLYIDIPKPKKAKPKVPYHSTSSDHLTIKTKTTVSYDPKTQLRTTLDRITHLLSDTETTTTAQTYPISAEELINMLLDAGFQRVEKSPVTEAFYIDAYIAFAPPKPAE